MFFWKKWKFWNPFRKLCADFLWFCKDFKGVEQLSIFLFLYFKIMLYIKKIPSSIFLIQEMQDKLSTIICTSYSSFSLLILHNIFFTLLDFKVFPWHKLLYKYHCNKFCYIVRHLNQLKRVSSCRVRNAICLSWTPLRFMESFTKHRSFIEILFFYTWKWFLMRKTINTFEIK